MRRAVIVALVFGCVACGPKSLIGQPCSEAGKSECDVNDDPNRLVRCDGKFFVALADCAEQCIEKKDPVTHAGGPLTADETWACADGPHVVTTTVSVAAGVTLTIGEGALVKLQPASHIDTDREGFIVAVGSDAAPILITAATGEKNGFGDSGDGGLDVFAATTSGESSDVEHVIIERGIQGLGVFGLSSSGTPPIVKNNTMRDNTNFAILITCDEVSPPIPDFAADGNQFFGNGGDVSTCGQQLPGG